MSFQPKTCTEQYQSRTTKNSRVLFQVVAICHPQCAELGNIFSSIAKTVLPLVKSRSKAIGKQILCSGVDFALNVLSGKYEKQAAIDRAKAAGSNLLKAATRKRKSGPQRTRVEKRRSKKHHDIIDSNGVLDTPQLCTIRDVAAAPQTPHLGGGPRPTLGAQVSLKLLFGYVTIFSSADLFTTDLNCRKKLACDIISEC